MSGQSRGSPVVLAALKVICEDTEDQLMDSLGEFRVSHRARLAALMSQSVAEGLNVYSQQGEQSTYDAEALVGVIFGDLPGDVAPWDDAAQDAPVSSGVERAPVSTGQGGVQATEHYVDELTVEDYSHSSFDPAACACLEDYQRDDFLLMLRFTCPALWQGDVVPYDFAFLPCPRVVILNFLSHDLCMSCLTLVGRHARTGHGHIGKVQQASYQGLAENLAAFYAKAGRRGLESTNAPSVLLRGQPMSLRHAIKQLVPPDMVVQTRTAVRTARQMRQRQVPDSGRPAQSSSSTASEHRRTAAPSNEALQPRQTRPLVAPADAAGNAQGGSQIWWQADGTRYPIGEESYPATAIQDAPGIWIVGDERPPPVRSYSTDVQSRNAACELSARRPSGHSYGCSSDCRLGGPSPEPLASRQQLGALVVTERNGVLLFDL